MTALEVLCDFCDRWISGFEVHWPHDCEDPDWCECAIVACDDCCPECMTSSVEPASAQPSAPGAGIEHLPVGAPGAVLLPRLDPQTAAINDAAISALQAQAGDVIDLRTEGSPGMKTTATTHISIRVKDQHGMSALASPGSGEGSVFIGKTGNIIQFSGTPAQLRSISKAIEDGAMEIERLLMDEAVSA